VSEDQDRERFASDEGDDVEAHKLTEAERFAEPDDKIAETDDPDVEGHALAPKINQKMQN
jgi:hypothetical protein